jgi:peptidoglycan/LPS O-acetylase OafA/YrhL
MQRKIQLDGLRGMAVLTVFFYHVFRAPLLWFGVDLFFVLSGYLITSILIRMKQQQGTTGSALKSFYIRRAYRILPAFLLFMFVVTVAFHVQWAHLWYWFAFFDANFAYAFKKVFPSEGGVWALAPLWSLAVEEQFYFVWPLVVLLSSAKTLKRVALGIIVVAPVLRAICTPLVPPEFIYSLTPFRMDTLACGAAIAIFEHDDPTCVRTRHRLAGFCAIGSFVILCALSSLHTFRRSADSMSFNTLGYSLVVFVFGATVFYALGSSLGVGHAILTLRPLRYMGQISYTFYLYHLGLLILMREQFHSPILAALLAFGIAGAIAAVSWPFFESPILRLQRSAGVDESKVAPKVLNRAGRFPVRLSLRYRELGCLEWIEGKTENMSRSGILFRAETVLIPKTKVEMRLAFPMVIKNRALWEIVRDGVVVRAEQSGIGGASPTLAVAIQH